MQLGTAAGDGGSCGSKEGVYGAAGWQQRRWQRLFSSFLDQGNNG